MNSLQLLTDFWKEATFEDYSKMVDAVLPQTGKEYRRGKFIRFQSNLSKWLCDLSPGTLERVEAYLHSRYVDNMMRGEFEKKLLEFKKDTLTAYMAIMVPEMSQAKCLKNMASLEEMILPINKETGGVDSDPTAPASETDELTQKG